MKNIVLVLMVLLCGGNVLLAQENYKDKHTNVDFSNTEFYDVKHYDVNDIHFKNKPKNIILLIGDGMGVTQVFTGITANKGDLNLCNFKNVGFSRTQSADHYVTDSAAGGTALACGTKTNNGVIGLDADSAKVESILEYADANGKSTGLVSTSAITHATPASFIAHQVSRKMYEAIAADFLKTDIDVFIGGGAKHFKDREDGRDLTDSLKAKGYNVAYSLADVKDVHDGKLAVLTAEEHNERYPERGNMLVDATEKAIDVLSKDKNGFFLMVEGSQIDWGGHQNDASYVAQEMLDFDRAIGKALAFAAQDKETLIIITADHETGGMALPGGDMKEGKVESAFVTGHHSAVMVPVFAFGPGAENFGGIYENTEVFQKMLQLYGFKK